jgi:F-type H+-transporting ATPase subunit b
MNINWFTVIAQILNFLVLAWLLKRYLYKPILEAIDVREKRIVTQIANAEKKDADATKKSDEFQNKNKVFDQERDILMTKAKEEAKVEGQRLLEEARKDSLDLSKKLEASLKEEQLHLGSEIVRRTKVEVFSIVRKPLKDLVNTNLEDQIVNVLVNRLKRLSEEEKKVLDNAFKANQPAEIVVQSMYELNPTQQNVIADSFKQALNLSASFKFEQNSDLMSGIELNANGYTIAWSISEYLSSMEKAIDEVVKTNAKAEKHVTA